MNESSTMLPIPARKGSCKACRESNSECDKKRPRCSECVAKNMACGGYDLGNIFINMNSAGPPPVWSRSQNAQKYLVLDWASQSDDQDEEASGAAMASPPPLDANSGSIHGMTELFLELYYRRVGPDKASTEPLRPGSECGGWRSLLPQLIGQSPILDTAIRALASCFIATQYHDQNLLYQSRNLYLSALQQVQQVLPEQNSATRRDVLATTLVMSSIEIFMGNGGAASQLTHIEGAARLLYFAFTQQTFEELHLYILSQGFFVALATRSRFAFGRPEYRSQVRQLFSIPRTYTNDHYFRWTEMMLPLPSILYSADGVSSATPGASILAMLDDLTVLEQTMFSWYENVKATIAGAWTFPTAQTGRDVVPFPLQFISIEACTIYNLYWMSQLLILDTRRSLLSSIPTHHIPPYHTHPDPVQIAEYASLICRSFQFCTQNRSFAATENMLTPIFMVAAFYKRQGDTERLRWCVRNLERIADEQKIGFPGELVNYAEGTVYAGGPSEFLAGVWDDV
ncbi:hypothetical protein BU24DRAFT_56736 [Aaosphaeria arxii CBS 175.79]|uniref:Zn(2)-C6 fungal-type domain-containing protein n=1 Tax=Aaosphaeria arxii CBS 175.79 TaxID=1450172 RepID=A0A6A5XC11_9PLEO|nr:uncharacterized protein BU24DRAFT_56736 [Aaosphaeria arxii CBS 175.79]KAF2010347.1 hypothetical protein BU24DRAFT_56736 [Aaosphaeria arxii CBS 175.79]